MVRWLDMVDPVYTLALLAGIDPDENDITGIIIQDSRLIIYYNDSNGSNHFVSKKYNLN